MKSQSLFSKSQSLFSREKQYENIKLSSAEFAQRVVKVKEEQRALQNISTPCKLCLWWGILFSRPSVRPCVQARKWAYIG